MMMRWGVSVAGAAVVAAGPVAVAGEGPGTVVLQLQNHPDSFHRPPTYGLRLDHLFVPMGGPLGFVTFSFDHFSNTTLTVSGSTVSIAGTVYGGHDTGTEWGFGEGAYALNFTYTANVSPSGTGWTAAQSPLNSGTLTALGDNNGVPAGTVFEIFDRDDPPPLSFQLLRDGHRLTPEQVAELQNPWVGRGGLRLEDGFLGTRSWIFLAVPSPGTAAGVCVVLAGMGRRRRE